MDPVSRFQTLGTLAGLGEDTGTVCGYAIIGRNAVVPGQNDTFPKSKEPIELRLCVSHVVAVTAFAQPATSGQPGPRKRRNEKEGNLQGLWYVPNTPFTPKGTG